MTITRTLLCFVLGASAFAADPQRPPIVGIANFAAKVSNVDAARNFYGHVLGYQEAFTMKQMGGAPDLICFKVNDHQYLEIAPGLKDEKEDRLIHIAFETKDARKLRDYLAAKGVKVPAKAAKDPAGNLSFTVMDPEDHAVEFVQYLPGSIHSRNFGKFMPDTRVSDHMLHVGIHVLDRAKADAFYKDILGFRFLWEGGPPNNTSAWISYLVPDGSDWVEYMMGNPTPTPRQLGGMHHACLGVMDIQKRYETVVARGYTPPNKPILARDGRMLANFFDPDLTRTEMMIRKPVQTPCCSEMHDPYIK
jgi:lactoylglutathione lyase